MPPTPSPTRVTPDYGVLTHLKDPVLRDVVRLLFDRLSTVDQNFQQLQTVALQAQQFVDAQSKRVKHAKDPIDPQDLVTLVYLKRFVANALAVLRRQEGEEEQGPCAGSTVPLVELPNYQSEVEAYAAAHPAELANSCAATGGNMDFMNGLVAHLQGLDERFGLLGQAGEVSDWAEDAVTYYHGALPPIEGSLNCYGVDVIAGHCGPDPQGAWIDVSDQCGAGAAYILGPV